MELNHIVIIATGALVLCSLGLIIEYLQIKWAFQTKFTILSVQDTG